ncbi:MULTISPECIES: Dot/Icm T4SS effector AnkC/LegA12 [Legionella]|uniref:Ankyrin repeat-containing protein n=1 Tax=Legionella drozanskii LLAP-1 TaxID=1212489 RepID=A0A0W0SS27_9GAMM|nr:MULTISPECIES: Dot/Icm T4SS effector AnkC/LegA12 [Legionella]KTC86126.1 ankyrin repeat-containing protein [Legionella drozanskii LLAP-1]PJE17642.1 MAG: ankyrin repeat domain-containing protein [Legionella sp.]
MKSFAELERAIELGEKVFEAFIHKEASADKNFFERRFLFKETEQITVLNYLIHIHEVGLGKPCRKNHIKMLLSMGADFNLDCSIHLLLRLKKLDLFPLFFQDSDEESEARRKVELDFPELITGRTLLSRAISTGNASILSTLLRRGFKIDVNAPNQILVQGQTLTIQPLHQAVATNFPEATYYLLENGAIVDNPCGRLRETPLLLAARLGTIKSLEVLLFATAGKNCLDLQAENSESDRAIDLLCKRLKNQEKPQEALYGIAMLLCHGAKAPRDEGFRSLLIKNRFALIDQVKEYKKQSGNSAVLFVRACHDKNNPLHDIIYANTWLHLFWRYSSLQWIWHLLGLNCDEAFRVEALVYDGPESNIPPAFIHNEFQPLESIATNRSNEEISAEDQASEQREEINLNGEELDYKPWEREFAQFTWRYGVTCGLFRNPASTMYRNLTLGECTNIDQVREYSGKVGNETTTTRTVINAMYGEPTPTHENLFNPF